LRWTVLEEGNFHLDGYEFVSFNRILKRKGTEFPVNAFPLAKLDFILDVVMGLEGRCFSRDQYLAYIPKFNLVDIIVGNEDRQLNNFGVFRKGGYVTIPLLFDFSLGLFGHDRRYYRCETLDDAIEKMECKPFYDSPVGNAMWMRKQFPRFLQGILPKRLLLGKGLIPNSLAFGYLGYICGVLGTEVQKSLEENGMEYYDPETLIRFQGGRCVADDYWVKF